MHLINEKRIEVKYYLYFEMNILINEKHIIYVDYIFLLFQTVITVNIFRI